MVRKRIIPCLLLHKKGLYKTKKFKEPTYIGDPINAAKIFNEKKVNELVVFDIDASVKNFEPNYRIIGNIVSECFIPITYGGGVKSINQMEKLFKLGIEKISLSTEIILNPNFLTEAANIFGSQSVVVTLDVKKDFFGRKRIYIYNGNKNTNIDPLKFVKQVVNLGAGEIIINSIDLDGTMNGFDIILLKEIKSTIKVPVIGLGGAGNESHINDVFIKSSIDGVCCGSLFLYQGPLRSVLINYPFS